MDQTTLIVVVVAIALAIFAFWFWQNRRSMHLRERFGDEYDNAIGAKGSLSRAEDELAARERRVSQYNIVPLSEAQRTDFTARWKDVQAEFVDEPVLATEKAAILIREVMGLRGYPTENFEAQAADLSVDHPAVVTHYREAHAIGIKHKEGDATTEDMRQAMVHYRTLFDDLVTDGVQAGAAPAAASASGTAAAPIT